MRIRLLRLALVAVLAVPVLAQTPCDWTPGTAVTVTCGNVGIGTASAPNVLTVFGAASRSQVKVTRSDGEGVLSMLSYAPDNVSIGFDVDHDGIAWKARHSTSGWLYKNNNRLMIMGSGGNTVGGVATTNAWFRINLTDGVAEFVNAALTTATINGGVITLTGAGNGLTFGGGQRIYDAGNGHLRTSGGFFGVNTTPVAALDVVGANIRLHNSSAAMLIVESPTSAPAGILLRSGATESTHIFREGNSNDLVFMTNNSERLRIAAALGPVDGLTLSNTYTGGMALKTGGSTVARVHTAVHDWFGITMNARYNGTWVKDDASKAGWILAMDSRPGQDAFVIARSAPNTAGTADLLKINAAGDVTVAGNIGAKYQDLAEWVPATTEMPAGTVVVLNPERSNEVMASAAAYDTSVAGVVSAKPGVILGEAGEGKAMIATTGRVKVRVDATGRAVKVGDLLVTSDKPGVAMPSTPVEFGGVRMHRPGTIIGKALEPLAAGEGEILVLLSLQ